ncbi:MAG: 3-coathanger stack domain-containing protein [Bacteroidota bacterium]
MKFKIILFTLLAVFRFTEGIAQNSFKITGGNVKITDDVAIVLKDCQLKNNGTLTATNGALEIRGTATKAQSEIGGTGTSIFHNLKINKASNDAQLGHSITVNNQMEMVSGKLDLRTHTLTLGTANGTLIGESEIAHITATSTGRIIKTFDLNAPSNQNPGNLGIEITSTANLGLTEIHRGHDHQTVPTGTSIFRHFTILPTNNQGLDASLTFRYLDTELNGIPEDALVLMENNGGWMIDGFDSRNSTNNTVSFSGYDGLYQYTLGANEADADMDGIPIGMDNCPNDSNADQADEDNDMVGDVCDVCPNGDDMVDANTNNIIDDCECKLGTMNLSGTVNQDSVYVAGATIESNSLVTIGRKVVYKAQNTITLKTGFQVAAGADFLATLATCEAPSLQPQLAESRTIGEKERTTLSASLTAVPNIVQRSSLISYHLSESSLITLALFNSAGQQLTTFAEHQLVKKGHHQLTWTPQSLPAGVYFLQLITENQSLSAKVVWVN